MYVMDYKASDHVRCDMAKDWGGCANERGLEKFVAKVQGQFSKEEIGSDNHDRSHNDGLGGGAANTLGAATDVESFVAANGGEDETVNHGLGETLHQVGEVEGLDGAGPKFHRA